MNIIWEVSGSVPHVMSKRFVRLAASAAAVGALVAPVAANAGPLTPATSFSPRSALNLAIESFPQKNVLPVWPDNPNDASIASASSRMTRSRPS